MLRRSQWTGPVKSSQHWSIRPCWSRIWVACTCTRSKQLLIRKYIPTTSLAVPSHCLLGTNLTIARIEKQRHEISAAFVDASKGCNFSFSEAGPCEMAFCWPWDAGWVQLLWHVGKCKSLDQSVMTFEFPSWHVHLHLNRIWCFSGCTGWFFLGGAAGAQSCLHRALWGPWTQGPCSTIGLH